MKLEEEISDQVRLLEEALFAAGTQATRLIQSTPLQFYGRPIGLRVSSLGERVERTVENLLGVEPYPIQYYVARRPAHTDEAVLRWLVGSALALGAGMNSEGTSTESIGALWACFATAKAFSHVWTHQAVQQLRDRRRINESDTVVLPYGLPEVRASGSAANQYAMIAALHETGLEETNPLILGFGRAAEMEVARDFSRRNHAYICMPLLFATQDLRRVYRNIAQRKKQELEFPEIPDPAWDFIRDARALGNTCFALRKASDSNYLRRFLETAR